MSITKPATPNAPNHLNYIVIFGLLPEFLGKPSLWYEEQSRILTTTSPGNPLLREKIAILELGKRAPLPELLRTLDELGYEKVLTVGRFGEFAHRGGIVDIFPINAEHPLRIEFSGNRIEDILELPQSSDLARTEWEKITRRSLAAPLENLREGDFLVHLDHGIGRFRGQEELVIDAEQRRYLVLDYAQGDRLFVPEELAPRKLSRYIGFREPSVHRLGGTAWLITKRRVRENAQRFAHELLELYAKRTFAHRPPYHDDSLLEAFSSSFPYEETPDQLRAWREVLHDLNQERPMDRLLAGDVGFGKTEVALRAAVLAATNGRQTALLTPTTVLADQHFRTSRRRLQDIGIRAALLTRLQSKREQRATLKAVTSGGVDILIGTHRILSSDVHFKRLGLLVIDEEQRFGVKQKEAFKKLRGELDVLALSATPIPRTIAQSLAHIRPMSRLQIAPAGRTEIATVFGRWDNALVRAALLQEHQRGGQSYVLHNRVATIAAFVRELRVLASHIRFGVVHGRLSERELIETMQRLREGKIDVLVATTIIENGLDLANVNTLVVEDAGKLGLAQSYQLRGRIGRSANQAYAYFLWRGRTPKGKAALRLRALKEAATLGSGWGLAVRDLEIRGAGNLLGREQSGVMNRVGFNLYTQLLAEAVETIRGQPSQTPA